MGALGICWLGEPPDARFGLRPDGRRIHALLSEGVDVAFAKLTPGFMADCRMYVSSVHFRGSTLVTDGFDNQVLQLELSAGATSAFGGEAREATEEEEEEDDDDESDEESD